MLPSCSFSSPWLGRGFCLFIEPYLRPDKQSLRQGFGYLVFMEKVLSGETRSEAGGS